MKLLTEHSIILSSDQKRKLIAAFKKDLTEEQAVKHVEELLLEAFHLGQNTMKTLTPQQL